jgi:hypothetical protein
MPFKSIRAVGKQVDFMQTLEHHAVAAVLALLDATRIGKGTEEQG